MRLKFLFTISFQKTMINIYCGFLKNDLDQLEWHFFAKGEKKKDTYFQLHKSLEIETKGNKVNTYQNLKYIVKKKSIYNRF